MSTKRIAILLATYNSEPYLKEQLDSLFRQDCLDWVLYIRDDGSTDSTLEVISLYQEKHENIILLRDDKKNIGPMLSFFTLLEKTEAEFYMFCDHDDVWLENKVSITLSFMNDNEEKFPNKPIVIHSDLFVVDENLQIVSKSFWKYSGINQNRLNTFNELAVCNSVTGCTMMINKFAKLAAFPVSPYSLMHDSWISLCCIANDGIIQGIDSPTILYRQHTKNQIGAKNVTISYYLNKFLSLRNVLKGNLDMYRMAKSIKNLSVLTFFYHKLFYMFNRFSEN